MFFNEIEPIKCYYIYVNFNIENMEWDMGKSKKMKFSVVKNNSSQISKKNKGKFILQNKDELIRKRKKRKAVRRSIFLIILLVATLVTLCLKLPYFNIKYVEITGNKKISSVEIEKLSEITKGNNIFHINTKHIKTNIMSNPYILEVDVKRKFPDMINVIVKERVAEFYSLDDDKYVIIDPKGILLERKIDLDNMNLVKLEGFKFSSAVLGEVIPCEDYRKIKLIGEFTELIHNNKSGVEISVVNVEDITDIKIYCNAMEIKLGTSEKLINKLNKAFNILLYRKLEHKKGYIDVSYDGNPVVFLEE